MSFLEDAKIIIKELNNYFEESKSGHKPTINQQPLEKLVERFSLDQFVQNGDLSQENLRKFVKEYLSITTRLHSPNFLGHQVAPPHYSGALGSLIDGFTNNAMAIYEMGPGAASIEYFLINWLLEKVGWTPAPLKIGTNKKQKFGGGILTHGGSLANLTGLIAARNKVAPNVWQEGNPRNLAILAPQGCHYSIERAAGILGIGQNSIFRLEVDERGAIIPDRLESCYKKLIEDKKTPFALVANACSTPVGIYDPLSEIADFCQEKNMWFHIDGAHGASALLSDRYKNLLKGVEKADSLTWDAHKLMRTPTLCAALLVKDHQTIDSAFEQEASYIFHEKKQPGFDFIHRSVECTKAGLGLRLFMVVAAIGEKGLAGYIDNQFDLTTEVYKYINQQPEFNCAVKPQSNILCFQIKGNNKLQLEIRDKLTAEGEFYITTTLFNNKRYLRLSIMNPDTNLETIKKLIQRIKDLKLTAATPRREGN